jgi:thioredoxin-dependent peroxiredoxin
VHVGDLAPDFELADQDGQVRRLSELLIAGPVVLFFYPAAMTFGCTRESCHFRDLAAEFAAAGAQRVGISADPVDKQKEFSTKHSFDYPLLSDTEYEMAGQYGVRRSIAKLGNRRMTFVIDTDRRVLGIIRSEIAFGAHADRALGLLRNRSAAA